MKPSGSPLCLHAIMVLLENQKGIVRSEIWVGKFYFEIGDV